jgi:hypothetical protein
VLRSLRQIRGWADVLFLWRAGLRVLGHLLDFRRGRPPGRGGT